MASSHRLFAGRLFAGRLFAPALFRGTGAEVVVEYVATCGPRSAVKPGKLSIVKQYLKPTNLGQLGKDCCCG